MIIEMMHMQYKIGKKDRQRERERYSYTFTSVRNGEEKWEKQRAVERKGEGDKESGRKKEQ
jgi:hypothetical protein